VTTDRIDPQAQGTAGGQAPPQPKHPPSTSAFADSPAFFKLLLILVVLAFLLVAVAMPLLYALPSPHPKLS
jgi:hypothetical protein